MIQNLALDHEDEVFRQFMLMADSLRTRAKSKRYFTRIVESQAEKPAKQSALLALIMVAYWDKDFIQSEQYCKQLIKLDTYSKYSLFALSLMYEMNKRMGKQHTLSAISSLMDKINKKILQIETLKN
ncbi:MAG TPA: hypothetical protein PKC21_05010 [Oligoflexia bacterium]|nr:hypothetical protein [Oligoflexia bacterium]HMR24695.1 hypothetical protein [Oligoflexia bacterium]